MALQGLAYDTHEDVDKPVVANSCQKYLLVTRGGIHGDHTGSGIRDFGFG